MKQNKTTNANARKESFTNQKRAFERAHASGQDYTNELNQLARTIAASVVKKVLDPQRKAAVMNENVSDSGQSRPLIAARASIQRDSRRADMVRSLADTATRTAYDKQGRCYTEVVNKDADKVLSLFVHEAYGDGLDLVQEAALALLTLAQTHAAKGEGWLDMPFAVRRLDRRVYLRLSDSAAYKDVETTPIREAFVSVRRLIENARSVQAVQNGFSYIKELTPDGLDAFYYRLGKYADLGGYDVQGYDRQGKLYTASAEGARSVDSIIAALNLTPKQAQVVALRMQGRGYKQIATYLGITRQAVQNALAKVQAKAEKIGFTYDMWHEMTSEE